MTKVSVIVPVYNVENYLRECLDSLTRQTLDDIEIICVDDGSTDSSPDILKEYEDISNFTVISQENGGLSAARNTGLKHAGGQYIYFLDSDDILCDNALERMYVTCQDKSLDLLIFKLLNFDSETKERFASGYYDMEYIRESVGDEVFSHSDIPDYVFSIAVTIQSKFFKSSLIEGMEFMEGYIFEDNPFFIESFLKAERVYFLDEYLYLKRERTGSITQTHDDKFFDFIPIANILIDLTKKHGVYDNYKASLFTKILNNFYHRFSQVEDKYKAEFFALIKNDCLEKKDEFDTDEVLQNLDYRLKEIFYSAIESQNEREFELSIKCIDLSHIIDRKDQTIEMKNQRIREIKDENRKLFNNTKRLSLKLNEAAYASKKLRMQNDEIKEELNDLKYVNSQLLSSTSWKITKPMRFVGRKAKK